MFQHTAARRRLRYNVFRICKFVKSFNTQPPEGGCLQRCNINMDCFDVSTHSRPKAAAKEVAQLAAETAVSTHSRPKAAASGKKSQKPKLGGFNTQPPEGGCIMTLTKCHMSSQFQHTAARRRLRFIMPTKDPNNWVSTHSRPKAAAH